MVDNQDSQAALAPSFVPSVVDENLPRFGAKSQDQASVQNEANSGETEKLSDKELLDQARKTLNMYPQELKLLNQFVELMQNMTHSGDLQTKIQKVFPQFTHALQQLKRLSLRSRVEKRLQEALRIVLREQIRGQASETLQILKQIFLMRHTKDRSIRENSIRAVKQLLKIETAISEQLVQEKYPVYVTFILEREYKSVVVQKERQQCFKLIQAWLNNSPHNFPLLFAQSIMSLVRNEEEFQLRFKALDFLISMCSKVPRVASQIGAFKQLIDSLIDLTLDGYRYDRISHALVLLINDPSIRVYFRPVVDLNRIFSIFTRPDGVDKDPHKQVLEKFQQQMNLAKQGIVAMMRSWQGVIYLTSSQLGLKSLVEALNQPIRVYKKTAIMEIFIEIFNVPIFIGGSDLSSSGGYMMTGGAGKGDNLLNNYVALLLQAFYHSGAYDALTKLGTTTEEGCHLNVQSKSLLKKIIYLSSYLLPEVPQFAQLIQLATDFRKDSAVAVTRTRATKLVKELSTVALRNPLEHLQENEVLRTSHNLGSRDFSPLFMHCYEYFTTTRMSLPNNHVVSYNQVDLKAQYFAEVDETRFKTMVAQTQIPTQKLWHKWNWDIILELVEGNLITPARLESLQRNKFLKRLLNFYLPSKKQFVELKWRPENFIYAKVGYFLIKRLAADQQSRKVLSNPEGVFQVFGVTFVEKQDNIASLDNGSNPLFVQNNIFHHKKSFLQDVRDMLENEVRYMQKYQKQRMAKYANKVVRSSQVAEPSTPGLENLPGSYDSKNSNEQLNQSSNQKVGRNTENLHQSKQIINTGNTSNHMGGGVSDSMVQSQTPNSTHDDSLLQASREGTMTGTSSATKAGLTPQTGMKHFFTKQRVCETMLRELISWLGLLSSDNKYFSMNGKMSAGSDNEMKNLLKKFGIFDLLEKLIDPDGYYDHFTQIILNSFSFDSDARSRKMMKKWVAVSSRMFTKSIFEYCRMLHRSGLYDYYVWCLPFLTQQTSISDRAISAAAFDVIEESCYDEQSLNQLLDRMETKTIMELQRQGDLFVAKFLRSEIGFTLLHSQGWVQQMLQYWHEVGNFEYIAKVEQSMYDGLSLHQVNGQDADYAHQIWIPIYEHSNDFRSELALLKRFPFQVMIKVESDNLKSPIVERMQTYLEIGSHNELQIVGRLIRNHSKIGRKSLEQLGNAAISVCTKLGDCFVDSKCRPREFESWTMSQIDSQMLQRLKNNPHQWSFFVMKDGVNFCFQRQEPDSDAQPNQNNPLAEFFLDQVILRIKILPVKYKSLKIPIHFYGELVKTKAGADFLRQSKHVEHFAKQITSSDTNLLQKRAALWALGHIGSNQYGISLILGQDLISPIINLAENAEFLSLRGTCIYIIGMLSNTFEGKKEICRFDWIASRTKSVTSVCLPKNPSTLFRVSQYSFDGSMASDKQIDLAFRQLKDKVPLSAEETEVVTCVGKLLNGVSEVQAINELRKKMEHKPQVFQSKNVFEHVCLYFTVYKFRPKARKFVYNLFEQILFDRGLATEIYYKL